jgi:hypothetical protein
VFLRAQKNVVEQDTAEGAAQTVFCGTQNRRSGGFALTALLSVGLVF